MPAQEAPLLHLARLALDRCFLAAPRAALALQLGHAARDRID